jgi:hypothetical protein
LRANENDDKGKQKASGFEDGGFSEEEKFAMGEFSSQHAPLNEAVSFRERADHQQGQQKKDEIESYSPLSAKFLFPDPCRRENQEDWFNDRPKNYQ